MSTFRSICLKIGDKLLFLGKHCLESVQLSLQLFNRDLTSTLWGRGVLGNDDDVNDDDDDCDGDNDDLGCDPAAELTHVAIQLVPALH